MNAIDNLFIAEKPSLAEEVAKARADQLGATAVKTNGYWHVGADVVTWLFGHMYETAKPDVYDQRYKTWNVEDLPIIPAKWQLIPDAGKRDHIATIKALLGKAKGIVNAGDAGREGQLLVDELLIENGVDPFASNVRRLWVRSVVRKDLLDALNSMALNEARRPLYWAAVGRQRADWLLGMNLSRLYTKLAERGGARVTISVGRVKTPTLKLVVDRDREIESFKPVNHFLPTVRFRHANGTFAASWIIPDGAQGLDHEGRLFDKAVADRIAAKVNGKTGRVVSYKSETKSEAPPLPYSLSELQKDCSDKLGLTAQQTLDVAQKLYETYKVTTYPRSDSRYLPVSLLRDEAPSIMRNLGQIDDLAAATGSADLSLKSAAWNDAKISDHHAIIPTTEASAAKLGALSDVERQVFLLIARAFIAQFHGPRRWNALSAVLEAEGEQFKASGRQPLDQGWKRVYGGAEASDEADEDQTLPPMQQGDTAVAEAAEVKALKTTPPSRFTDGSLIDAMKNVHRFVSDAEQRKQLKENEGIGTEATRAPTIEELISGKVLARKGKQLVSTDLGRSIIDILPAEVTDPAMTARWESALEQVSRGEMTLDEFMDAQVALLRQRIDTAKGGAVEVKGVKKIEPLSGHGDACPKCGHGHLITREVHKGDSKGKRFLSCDRYPACNHSVWPKKEVEHLPGHGKTCPTCGTGTMQTREIQKGDLKGRRFLGCSGFPVCKHSEWPK